MTTVAKTQENKILEKNLIGTFYLHGLCKITSRPKDQHFQRSFFPLNKLLLTVSRRRWRVRWRNSSINKLLDSLIQRTQCSLENSKLKLPNSDWCKGLQCLLDNSKKKLLLIDWLLQWTPPVFAGTSSSRIFCFSKEFAWWTIWSQWRVLWWGWLPIPQVL
jgi:hypothetical protein